VHPEAPNPLVDAPNVTQEAVRAAANGPATLLYPHRLGDVRESDVFHATFNIVGFTLPCPIVTTILDLSWWERPDLNEPNPFLRPFEYAFYNIGIRSALKRSNHILTISNFSADKILELDPTVRERLHVTYCSCGDEFVPPIDRQATRERAARLVGSDVDYYLIVGWNPVGKGHDVALQAFATSAPAEHHLVLVRRGAPPKDFSRTLVKLGIEDRVHWIDGATNEDCVVLMQSALALLQPSRYEGFGLPALEAMAVGCPVIASDIPALVEVMGGAGIHTRVGDTDDLARAIAKVSAEPALREELREHGLERRKAFSWDRTASATLEAFREAAGEGPRHHARNARAVRA
jgi:glycosyltransferase involved in cell wall biosynthesis